MEKELAWFRATTQGLEKLKVINLDPDVIATQLYEQKVKFLQVSLHITFILFNQNAINMLTTLYCIMKFYIMNH